MNDKIMQLRVNDEFKIKLEFLKKIRKAASASEVIRELVDNEYDKKVKKEGTSTVNDGIESFILAKKVEGIQESTIKIYRSILNNFNGYVNKDLENITRDDIIDFIITLKNSKATLWSVAESYRAVVCKFFRWLYENEMIDEPIFKITLDDIKIVQKYKKI